MTLTMRVMPVIMVGMAVFVAASGAVQGLQWAIWGAFVLYIAALGLTWNTWRIETTSVGITKQVLWLRSEVLWREARPAGSRRLLTTLWSPGLGGRKVVVQGPTGRVTFPISFQKNGVLLDRDIKALLDVIVRHCGADDDLRKRIVTTPGFEQLVAAPADAPTT